MLEESRDVSLSRAVLLSAPPESALEVRLSAEVHVHVFGCYLSLVGVVPYRRAVRGSAGGDSSELHADPERPAVLCQPV